MVFQWKVLRLRAENQLGSLCAFDEHGISQALEGGFSATISPHSQQWMLTAGSVLQTRWTPMRYMRSSQAVASDEKAEHISFRGVAEARKHRRFGCGAEGWIRRWRRSWSILLVILQHCMSERHCSKTSVLPPPPPPPPPPRVARCAAVEAKRKCAVGWLHAKSWVHVAWAHPGTMPHIHRYSTSSHSCSGRRTWNETTRNRLCHFAPPARCPIISSKLRILLSSLLLMARMSTWSL